MPALDFPSSPSVGQTYTAAGTAWKWDGTTWNSAAQAPAAAGNVSNVGMPTNGQMAQWTDATHIQGINFTGLTAFGTPSVGQVARWHSGTELEGITGDFSRKLYFDIRDYGTTMDQTTVNAAIAAAHAAGGGTVFFPPGQVTTTAPIVIPDSNHNIRLLGCGTGVSRIAVSGSASTSCMLSVIHSNNITVEHLTFDAGSSVAGYPMPWCVIFSQCDQCRFSNCEILNMYDSGLGFTQCTNCWITDNRITKASPSGGYVNYAMLVGGSTATSLNNRIVRNTIIGSHCGVLGNNIYVIENISHGSAFGGGFSSGGDPSGSDFGKYIFIGNLAQYTSGRDINGTLCDGYEIQGFNCLIANNTAQYCASLGLGVFASLSLVVGNHLHNNGQAASASPHERAGLVVINAGGTGNSGSSNFIVSNFMPSDTYQTYGYATVSSPAGNVLQANQYTAQYP